MASRHDVRHTGRRQGGGGQGERSVPADDSLAGLPVVPDVVDVLREDARLDVVMDRRVRIELARFPDGLRPA